MGATRLLRESWDQISIRCRKSVQSAQERTPKRSTLISLFDKRKGQCFDTPTLRSLSVIASKIKCRCRLPTCYVSVLNHWIYLSISLLQVRDQSGGEGGTDVGFGDLREKTEAIEFDQKIKKFLWDYLYNNKLINELIIFYLCI